MRLPQGQRWRSGGPVSWLWRATRAATTSSTFRVWGAAHPAVFYRWAGKLAGWLQVISFPLALPWSMKTVLFLIFFYPGSELFRQYGKLCVQVIDETFVEQPFWHAVAISYFWDRYPLWCPLIVIAEVFYAGKCGVKADCDREGIHETNQDAAAVCVFYCSAVSCHRLKPVIVLMQLQ